MLKLAARVKLPSLVIRTAPLDVVVTAPLKVKLFPTSRMPPDVFVFRVLLNVVVPVPSPCEIEAAVTAPKVALVAVKTEREPKRVPEPIAPEHVMLPVPAFKTKFWPPSIVDAKLMLPTPEPVSNVTGPVNVTAPVNEIGALGVVTLPAVKTPPEPV